LGDAKGLGKVFGEVEDKGGKMGSILEGVGQKVGQVLTQLPGMAFDFGKQVLETGGALDTMAKKAAVVFGDSIGAVKDWADANANAMGLTSAQAIGAAASMGDLLKPMGFTAQAAADMSTKMIDLSGALAAWSGGEVDAQQVSELLTKAMLGETDGLKQLGISISAAEVQARLLAKGQKDLTGEALAQAKAIATQELIMEKSTDAQKAWADGTMDGVKAQNESKASMAQMQETLMQALYPALQAIVPILADVAKWLSDHLPAAIETVKGFFETKLMPVIQAVGDFFGRLVGWVQDHWTQISAVINTAVGIIKGYIEGWVAVVTELWSRFGDNIVTAIKGAWDLISGIVEAAVKTIKGIIDVFVGIFTGDWGRAWDGIKGIVEGVWTAIKTLVKAAIDAVKLIITTALDGIKLALDGAWTVIKAGFQAAFDAMKAIVKGAWEGIKTLFNGAVTFITGLPGTFLTAAKSVGTAIWDGIKTGVGALVENVGGFFTGMLTKIAEFPEKVLNAAKGVGTAIWNGVKNGVGDIVENVGGFFVSVVKKVGEFPSKVFDAAKRIGSSIWEGVKSGFSSVAGFAGDIASGLIGAVKSAWNSFAGMINRLIPDSVGFGPFSFDLPDNPIPTFHSGGRVPGGPNDEVLALLQGGEVVLTKEQQRGFGGSTAPVSAAGASIIVNQYVTVEGSVTKESDLMARMEMLRQDAVRRGALLVSA